MNKINKTTLSIVNGVGLLLFLLSLFNQIHLINGDCGLSSNVYASELSYKGYYHRVTILSGESVITRKEASDYCLCKYGTNLASIINEDENIDAIGNGNWYNNYGSIWIGLNDIKEEGKFVWDDSIINFNLSYSYNNWLIGSPNNGLNSDCVLLYSIDGGWQSANCSGFALNPTSFLCNSFNHQNNIYRLIEFPDCGLSLNTYVSELSDAGYYHRVAVSSGQSVVSRQDASDYCLCEYGTNLASIINEDETIDAIGNGNFYSNYGSMWIGLNDKKNEGIYVWDDKIVNNSLYYNNWFPGLPTNSLNSDCVILDSFNGEWQNANCSGFGFQPNAWLCNSLNHQNDKYRPFYYKDATNLLCSPDEWGSTSSNWIFNNNECSITQSDILSSVDKRIWLGDSSGVIPNEIYNYDSFELLTTFSINNSSSNDGTAGVVIRQLNILNGYYIGLNIFKNELITGRLNNGIYTPFESIYITSQILSYNTIYTIKIESTYPNYYSIYLNDELIIYNIAGDTSSGILYFGSVGLRTNKVSATYYKFILNEWIQNDIIDNNGNDICITVTSDKSDKCNGCLTSITCPNNDNYILTGCSAHTFGRKMDGSYIENDRCYAVNGKDGNGIYAVAQCCKINAQCVNVNNDDSTTLSRVSCDNTLYDKSILTGCTMYNDNKNLEGAYIIDNECYAAKDSDDNSNYINANGRCCAPVNDNNKLKCHTIWSDTKSGTGNDDIISVTCPNYAPLLFGCNAYSSGISGKMDGAYGNGNICYAQNGNGGNGVFAIARCCSEYSLNKLSDNIIDNSAHLLNCKNLYDISDITIYNEDNNGIINYCCHQVEKIKNSNTKKLFDECLKDNGMSYNIEGNIKYSLINNYINNNDPSQCSFDNIETFNIGSYKESSSILDTVAKSSEITNGVLSVLEATGNSKIKRFGAFVGGFSQIAGVALFDDSPDLGGLVDFIFENVFSFVSEVFTQVWDCTTIYVEYVVDELEESILDQLHLSAIEDKIERAEEYFYALTDENNYNDINDLWQQFGVDSYIWDLLRDVVTEFDGSITHTTIQRSIIPLLQLAINQRIFIYTRYAYIGINITNNDDDVKNLDRSLIFGLENEDLLDKYIEYFSGAYYDILLNSNEYNYNDIIGEINLLFNTKLFCNWVYFTNIFGKNGNTLEYCDSNICDCNGYTQLQDDIYLNQIYNGINEEQNAIDNWYDNYIAKQVTDYFLNDIFFESDVYLNNWYNSKVHEYKVSDLWINSQVNSINIMEREIYTIIEEVSSADRREFILNHPNGTNNGETPGCTTTRNFICENNKWYSNNNNNNDNILDFIYIENRMTLLPDTDYSCQSQICRFSEFYIDEVDSFDNGPSLNGYERIEQNLKCKNSDNNPDGSFIGARYILQYEDLNKAEYPSISGIELLCNENDLIDYYSNYKYFNFDNRNLLFGFENRDDIDINNFEWSPWFICPKKHKLEILIGSIQECKVCLNRRIDGDNGDFFRVTDDYFSNNDPYVSYRCIPF